MECSMMIKDCRAINYEHGAYNCTALNDTNFGERACPFYKPQWQYDRDIARIKNFAVGYTPIVLGD